MQPEKSWKKPGSSAPKQLQVQQTLTSCVRCGQRLKGPICARCSFDHIAQPIYLLCLISPRQLQINTDPDTEET